MSGNEKIFPGNYIGIFYPKKGFRKFLGLPFIVPFILAGAELIIILLTRSSSDEALREFLKLHSFVVECGVPAAAVVMDVIREFLCTGGYAGKSQKRLILLRSAPHMERVIKCAFIADEVRRLVTYVIMCIIGGTAVALAGQYETTTYIPGAMAFTAAAMYLASAVAILLVRFIDNHTVMFLTTYFWLMIAALIGIGVQQLLLVGDAPAAVTFIALLPGAAAGILGCRAAIGRACSCRRPQST